MQLNASTSRASAVRKSPDMQLYQGTPSFLSMDERRRAVWQILEVVEYISSDNVSAGNIEFVRVRLKGLFEHVYCLRPMLDSLKEASKSTNNQDLPKLRKLAYDSLRIVESEPIHYSSITLQQEVSSAVRECLRSTAVVLLPLLGILAVGGTILGTIHFQGLSAHAEALAVEARESINESTAKVKQAESEAKDISQELARQKAAFDTQLSSFTTEVKTASAGATAAGNQLIAVNTKLADVTKSVTMQWNRLDALDQQIKLSENRSSALQGFLKESGRTIESFGGMPSRLREVTLALVFSVALWTDVAVVVSGLTAVISIIIAARAARNLRSLKARFRVP